MQAGGDHQFEFILLLLLLFVVGFGTLAQVLKKPYPIVLVVGGLLLSLVPGLPRVSLYPDLIFLVILPPLLFSAGFNTSWRNFRSNLTRILLLAFGLVGFTTIGVALTAHWCIPGFDWRLGMVLGAVISPTDAIAATSIARRLRLPARIVDILEGESLVNDASGLLALEFAVGMVVSGHVPSPAEAAWRLAYLIAGGIGAGLLIGKAVHLFDRWISNMMRSGDCDGSNAPVAITASVVVPYLAYLGAEAIHASGVLAVVACGLFIGSRSSVLLSSAARIQFWATWNTFTFILNGIAFLLIGLQLRHVLSGILSVSPEALFLRAGIVVLAVIALRLAWVYPGAYLPFLSARKFSHKPTQPIPPRAVFIVGWTGMRGVVSLAAAMSLPELLANGKAFPQRNMIIFVTFCVIFVTLVLQGMTLPALIRGLALARPEEKSSEEEKGRRDIFRTALQHLDRMRPKDKPELDSLYEHVAEHYRARLAAVGGVEEQAGESRPLDLIHYREITRELRKVERSTALKLHHERVINDDLLRRVQSELDLLDVLPMNLPEGEDCENNG